MAITGELTPKVYTPQNGEPRPSLDVLAHAVLTEYHVARKRKAMREPEPAGEPDLDDELPSGIGRGAVATGGGR